MIQAARAVDIRTPNADNLVVFVARGLPIASQRTPWFTDIVSWSLWKNSSIPEQTFITPNES